jgi:hypothetical protein
LTNAAPAACGRSGRVCWADSHGLVVFTLMLARCMADVGGATGLEAAGVADVSAFIGPGVQAEGFGPVPDVDRLCYYLIEKAQVIPVRLWPVFTPHSP